jgi:hypothetical protein
MRASPTAPRTKVQVHFDGFSPFDGSHDALVFFSAQNGLDSFYDPSEAIAFAKVSNLTVADGSNGTSLSATFAAAPQTGTLPADIRFSQFSAIPPPGCPIIELFIVAVSLIEIGRGVPRLGSVKPMKCSTAVSPSNAITSSSNGEGPALRDGSRCGRESFFSAVTSARAR